MEPLMREGTETEMIANSKRKQEVAMMVLTERKVDHLKFIDPRHPLRTAYQTNSLPSPSLLNLNCYLHPSDCC